MVSEIVVMEFVAFLFGAVQFICFLALATLVGLIVLGEMGAFRFNHRELIPWTALVFILLVVPPAFHRSVYDFLVSINPQKKGYELWLFARFLSLLAALVLGLIADSAIDSLLGTLGVGRAGPEGDASAHPVVPAPKDNSPAANMVTTALEAAGSVRTRWQVTQNTNETAARIAALQNAERLAQAASRTAEAEAQAIVAMMRRTDQLSQLFVCQEVEAERRREYLEAANHQLTLADIRRKKERYETERGTLQAKHSLEATETFKEVRFDLGLARVKARQADVEVDSKTAEAAVIKIAAELSKLSRSKNPDINSWFESQIAALENDIEEREADGEDTKEQREELVVLKRLHGTEQGDA